MLHLFLNWPTLWIWNKAETWKMNLEGRMGKARAGGLGSCNLLRDLPPNELRPRSFSSHPSKAKRREYTRGAIIKYSFKESWRVWVWNPSSAFGIYNHCELTLTNYKGNRQEIHQNCQLIPSFFFKLDYLHSNTVIKMCILCMPRMFCRLWKIYLIKYIWKTISLSTVFKFLSKFNWFQGNFLCPDDFSLKVHHP